MSFEDSGTAVPDEVVESPEASGETIQPPAQSAPVPPDYSANFTVLNQQLRRLESRFDRGDPLIRQEIQSLRSQLGSLGSVVDEVNDLRAIVEVLIPEEHREPLQRQRQARRERASLEHKISELEAKFSAPPSSVPVQVTTEPDPGVLAAFQTAQASVRAYAEALDINIETLSQADQQALVQGVPQATGIESIGPMVSVLKNNLRTLAKSRQQEPPPVDTQAETRQQVRGQTTAPAARNAGGGARKSFRTEADWRNAHARGEITNDEARYWRAQNLPFQ